MKWTRAIHHLTELADACTRLASAPTSIHPLRVTELWAAGDVLGEPADLDTVTVALVVDLPEVPWLTTPPGAQHWSAASRLSRGPFTPYWRTRPVWNHRLTRPALIWAGETHQSTLDAIANGHGATVSAPAPEPHELVERIAQETATSLTALRRRTAEYAEKRWQPGKLDPQSDALWEATTGYLDLLDAAAHLTT